MDVACKVYLSGRVNLGSRIVRNVRYCLDLAISNIWSCNTWSFYSKMLPWISSHLGGGCLSEPRVSELQKLALFFLLPCFSSLNRATTSIRFSYNPRKVYIGILLWTSFGPTFCLRQVIWGLIELRVKYFWQEKVHSFSGQLVPVCNCPRSKYFVVASEQNFSTDLCLLPCHLVPCEESYLHLLYNYLLFLGRLWLHLTWIFSSLGWTNQIPFIFFTNFSNFLISLLALCWTLSSFLICLLKWLSLPAYHNLYIETLWVDLFVFQVFVSPANLTTYLF